MASRFIDYMRNHFASCRLIARARDEHRSRDVQIYAIPGYYEDVGVTDGTDCWVAPISAGPFFKTATGNLVEIMRALKEGQPLPGVPEAPRKRRVALEDEEEPQPRPRTRRIADESASSPASQPTRRTRHALV